MSEYGAESIRILEGLEPVRERPGMYIGSTSSTGLHHLVWEAVDNSIDEAMAGHCTEVIITHHPDGSISVEDNGRGIPVEIHPTEGVPAVQVVLTKLHAGGKFDEKLYGASGGLHGVGISCVNALSEKLTVQVWRNRSEYIQSYEQGIPMTELFRGRTLRTQTGTRVQFWPDPTIFETIKFDEKIISTRLKELSYLNAGLRILFVDAKGKSTTYQSKNGLIDYVNAISSDKDIQPETIQISGNDNGIHCFVALRWTKSAKEEIRSFCNNINTIEGGTHLTGFKTGLTRAATKFLANYIPKSLEQPSAEDIREGLVAVVSVRVPQPQFEGQTKGKLGTSAAQTVTTQLVYQKLNEYFEDAKKEIVKAIADRIINATKARLAAQRARDNARKAANLAADMLPGKLTDCQNQNPAERELFLVEGDSAGGCWAGETLIKLADGRSIPIAQMAEEFRDGVKHHVYSFNHKTDLIEIRPVKNVWLTKRNAPVVTATLDNEEKIRPTPDHLCMLRDGTYKEIKDIDPGRSLMALVTRYAIISSPRALLCPKLGVINYYEVVRQSKTSKWEFTHHLSGDCRVRNGEELPKGFHRHHKDKNPLNNDPSNIVFLSPGDHLQEHAEESIATKKTLEYRAYMSNRMKELSSELSTRSKKQWEDEVYKEFMTKKWREFYDTNPEYREKNRIQLDNAQKVYWADQDNRDAQSEWARTYYETHPEAREQRRIDAKRQWENSELRAWRAKTTSKQWTPEFREKRKKAMLETRKAKSLALLNQVGIEKYEQTRQEQFDGNGKGDKTLYKLRDLIVLYGTEKNLRMSRDYIYNHKLVSVEDRGERADVYDIEVEGTHNFALAAGIFVHNSAKQARDRRYQAILPLKGKILNCEKAAMKTILKNTEIQSIVAALGIGIGTASVDLDRLRYHKVIIMCDADVDGCLAGDTKVKLLDGTYPTMEELTTLYPDETTKFWVWANDGNGKHIPALAHSARVTRHVDEIYEIELDDGSIIRATGNHPFMLRTGEFIRADELIPGTSLMRMTHHLDDNDIKVTAIRLVKLEKPIPVYDLTVEKHHNFLVYTSEVSGIFVHNSHIRTLLLTLFFRHLPEVILNGNLYIAQAPLYRVKAGKSTIWAYDDDQLAEILKEYKTQPVISRFKGLGEMPPETLWKTTMDPVNRIMTQVIIESPFCDKMFQTLMGDDVQPRAEFITEHSLDASLDI